MEHIFGDDATQNIYNFYRENLHLKNKRFLEEVSKVSEIHHYKKGEYYLHEGDPELYLAFIGEGIMAQQEPSGIGSHRTKEIYSGAGYPIYTKSKLRTIEPAVLTLLWLTDGVLYCFPLEHLDRINRMFPLDILLLKGELLEMAVEAHVVHRHLTGDLTPVERYQWLKKHHPDYFDRISHVAIAEMLNMAPETLSRIRRRVGDIS